MVGHAAGSAMPFYCFRCAAAGGAQPPRQESMLIKFEGATKLCQVASRGWRGS